MLRFIVIVLLMLAIATIAQATVSGGYADDHESLVDFIREFEETNLYQKASEEFEAGGIGDDDGDADRQPFDFERILHESLQEFAKPGAEHRHPFLKNIRNTRLYRRIVDRIAAIKKDEL